MYMRQTIRMGLLTYSSAVWGLFHASAAVLASDSESSSHMQRSNEQFACIVRIDSLTESTNHLRSIRHHLWFPVGLGYSRVYSESHLGPGNLYNRPTDQGHTVLGMEHEEFEGGT